MQIEAYEVEIGASGMVFEFVSEGPKGRIRKFIVYTSLYGSNNYNLAFGDKNEITGDFSDIARSNNNDTDKVLTTVAGTIVMFLEKQPDAFVIAVGSTASRTRLYQMAISRNLTDLEADFEIFGLLGNEWKPFQVLTSYQAFGVKKRRSRLY